MAKRASGEHPPKTKSGAQEPPIELTNVDGVYTLPGSEDARTGSNRRRQRGRGGKGSLAFEDTETTSASSKESTAQPKVSFEELEEEKLRIRRELEILNKEGNRATRKHVPGPEAAFLKGEERIREIERLQKGMSSSTGTSSPDTNPHPIPNPELPDALSFPVSSKLSEGGPSAPKTIKPEYTGEAFSHADARKMLESLILKHSDLKKAQSVTPPADTPLPKGRKLSIKEMAKEAGVATQRDDMLAKEKAYLTAYQAYEKKNTWGNRLFKGKDLKAEEAALGPLKEAFNASRLAYNEAIAKSKETQGPRSLQFEKRMQKRFEALRDKKNLPKGADGKEIDFVTFMEQAEKARIESVAKYAQFREVVRPHAERKVQARIDGLNERSLNVFGKTLQFISRRNFALERFVGSKLGAQTLKAGLAAVVITGGAAMFGSLGAATALGLTGFGMYRFARSLGGVVIGAVTGKLGGSVYEFFGRKAQRSAAADLAREGRGSDKAITAESLDKLDAARGRLGLKAHEYTHQKNKAIAQALAAFVGGAGASTLLSMEVMQNAAEVAGNASLNEGHGGTTPGGNAGNPDVKVPGTPETPPTTLQGAEIHKGEGFNHLFKQLRDQDLKGDSAVVKYLNDPTSSPTELSQSVKALVEGKSVIMHVGDKVVFDDKQNLWFEKPDGSRQLLLENDPTAPGGIKVHELKDLKFGAPRVEQTETVGSPTPSPEVTPEPKELPQDPTAQLQQDQVAAYKKDFPNYGKVPDAVSTPASPALSEGMSAKEAVGNLGNTPDGVPGDNAARVVSSDSEGMSAREAAGLTQKSAEGLVTNSYGVIVDPKVPTIYEWTPVTTAPPYIVAEGASLKEALAKATEYATAHPGTRVLFPEEVIGANGTPEIHMSSIRYENGSYPVETNVTSSAGGTSRLLGRPNPGDFTRKFSN